MRLPRLHRQEPPEPPQEDISTKENQELAALARRVARLEYALVAGLHLDLAKFPPESVP